MGVLQHRTDGKHLNSTLIKQLVNTVYDRYPPGEYPARLVVMIVQLSEVKTPSYLYGIIEKLNKNGYLVLFPQEHMDIDQWVLIESPDVAERIKNVVIACLSFTDMVLVYDYDYEAGYDENYVMRHAREKGMLVLSIRALLEENNNESQ